MTTEKAPERNLHKLICVDCDYKCCKKSDWLRHASTKKHQNTTKHNKNAQKNAIKEHKCMCGKIYTHRASLFNHKKKCTFNENTTDSHITILTNLVLEVVKSNAELQKQMLEIHTINNSTINNNSHNKTFNMQFFLNEQCKDAMNIMDFVDTFKLQFSDLERVGEVGYVEGISDIIIRKLSEMDIYKRPIHCSDTKRETLYVKDNNVWEKENGNYNKLRLAIKHITKKNTDMLNPWCLKHPGSCDSDNYLNDIYLEMVMQAMGGRGGMEENENKIIKKIAKTVFIDKDL
jgi:hypothetical protein